MDHQAFVDGCSSACAVLSVERLADGTCGPIRIVCANEPYKQVMGPAFYDGMLYSDLVPRDSKFEDFCFRAAFMNQRMHAYVQTKAFDTWTDQIMIPLEPQTGDVGYCQFLFEFTKTAEPDHMADVSMDTAAAVIKATAILLGATDFKVALRQVLGDILEISGGRGTRIMVVNHETQEAINFCERLRDDMDPELLPGNGVIPYEVVRSWDDMIGVSNDVIVKDERDMDDLARINPVWIGDLREHGVNTLVLIPLRRHATTIGYLYVTNFDPTRVVEVKELLELMSHILGAEVANYLLLKRLRELSEVDSLTGLHNRNAMINRVGRIATDEPNSPFGVIYLDLNGLKQVNDQQGHDVGDTLLVDAARLLREFFDADDLYRSGGDEFVVISTRMTRDEFCERIERLRQATRDDGSVSFAIGSFWSDGTESVRWAFRQADRDMYADKHAYYASHPELQR